MVTAFLLLVLCDVNNPTIPVLKDTVDMVEVNHFYDETGALIFDQIIYWNWSTLDAKFNVIAWRLMKNCREVLTTEEKKGRAEKQPIVVIADGTIIRMPVIPKFLGSNQIPTIQPNGKYRAIWYEGDQIRKVWCSSVRETWTQFDPELLDRDTFPKDLRPGLKKTHTTSKKIMWLSEIFGVIRRIK